MVKLSFVLGTIGLFLILAEAENIVTRVVPESLEIPLGIILILYSGYRLGVKGFRIDLKR